MVDSDDFRRAKDPAWQSGQMSVVREGTHAGRTFRHFSDGSVVVEENNRRTVSLPDGLTIHETSNGLQVNHCGGIVAQIEADQLTIGDGLSFKYYGELVRMYSEDNAYVYECRLDRPIVVRVPAS